jgi:hypothetical protein
MCMAMLQNQAKNITCQKENLDSPASGTPVQIRVLATCQNSEIEWHPSLGRTATAAATKTRNIQGAQTLAKRAKRSKPRMANAVTTAPTRNTTITHRAGPSWDTGPEAPASAS